MSDIEKLLSALPYGTHIYKHSNRTWVIRWHKVGNEFHKVADEDLYTAIAKAYGEMVIDGYVEGREW